MFPESGINSGEPAWDLWQDWQAVAILLHFVFCLLESAGIVKEYWPTKVKQMRKNWLKKQYKFWFLPTNFAIMAVQHSHCFKLAVTKQIAPYESSVCQVHSIFPSVTSVVTRLKQMTPRTTRTWRMEFVYSSLPLSYWALVYGRYCHVLMAHQCTHSFHTTIMCPETLYLPLTLNCQFSFPICSQRLQSPIDCLGLPTLMPPSCHFLIHSSSLSSIVSSHLARSTRSPSSLLHSIHLPQ